MIEEIEEEYNILENNLFMNNLILIRKGRIKGIFMKQKAKLLNSEHTDKLTFILNVTYE